MSGSGQEQSAPWHKLCPYLPLLQTLTALTGCVRKEPGEQAHWPLLPPRDYLGFALLPDFKTKMTRDAQKVCVPHMCLRRSESNSLELVLSFQPVDLRDQTQVVGLGSERCYYLLSHLTTHISSPRPHLDFWDHKTNGPHSDWAKWDRVRVCTMEVFQLLSSCLLKTNY